MHVMRGNTTPEPEVLSQIQINICHPQPQKWLPEDAFKIKLLTEIARFDWQRRSSVT